MEYTHLTNLLKRIGEEVTEKYKDKLKTTGTYASGKLYNSVKYRIDVSSAGIKLLFVAEDYWINVENGRKAGEKMPPISTIQKWMISKGIPDNKGTAYIISRSIAKNGIKPKPFLRESTANLDKYTKELANALKSDLSNELNKKK